MAAVACLALMSSAVIADDVNRTGQPQTEGSKNAGTASQRGDANTMGGATTEKTEPSKTPQNPPANGTQPDTGSKTNAEPGSANQQKN
ncbi:hypothetical protein [Hyphomicrobium sp. 99]|uniref:hypothetical protein n=1 Tax=Hyphomicrobium sp. 99 TaxID=1163419 RepID=UPI0012E0C216|nr:hypothetical protein [Hyphomicrobium sp. 99]